MRVTDERFGRITSRIICRFGNAKLHRELVRENVQEKFLVLLCVTLWVLSTLIL